LEEILEEFVPVTVIVLCVMMLAHEVGQPGRCKLNYLVRHTELSKILWCHG